MFYKVPEKLISVICDHLISEYLPERHFKKKKGAGFNAHDLLFFATGAAALSEALTMGRRSLPKNYLNKKEYRAGYLLYFTITNYLKALFCLHEMGVKADNPDQIKILDVGTGPGTALLAAKDFFGKSPLELLGVDQNKGILKDASAILNKYSGPGLNLKTLSAEINSRNLSHYLEKNYYNVIFLSNVLGEIKNFEERLRLVTCTFRDCLAKNGSLIIIEPALRETTRELMSLRDVLLENRFSDLSINSPCLHHEACPMLSESRRDWCHMYLEWERPRLIEDVDKLIGNKKDYLKFSYLVLKKSPPVKHPRNLWRVVSAPLNSKGKSELLLCNHKKLFRLCRLDRDTSEKNADFDRLKRGDLVEYSGPARLTKTEFIKKRVD